MGICNLDGSIDVHAEAFRHHREFIRESDIDVPIGVLHDFYKLCCHVIGEEDPTPDEGSVDCPCPLTGLFGEGPYYPVVFHDFFEDVSRKDSLWTVHKPDVYVHFESCPAFDHWR